jgi:2-keto-4-pentenoate hydratase/2-oxohepta-3-ene-1,7-dioic acid hydratase in catechol pathway
MRLIRFGEKGQEKPGLFKDGRIVNLQAHFPNIPDIGQSFFQDGWLEKIAEIDDPGQEMTIRLGAPIAAPSKIICLGKNYMEHAKEGGFDVPKQPLLFCKTVNTVNGKAAAKLTGKWSWRWLSAGKASG